MAIHNDYFGAFICWFEDDVGIAGEFLEGFSFRCGEVVRDVFGGAESF